MQSKLYCWSGHTTNYYSNSTSSATTTKPELNHNYRDLAAQATGSTEATQSHQVHTYSNSVAANTVPEPSSLDATIDSSLNYYHVRTTIITNAALLSSSDGSKVAFRHQSLY